MMCLTVLVCVNFLGTWKSSNQDKCVPSYNQNNTDNQIKLLSLVHSFSGSVVVDIQALSQAENVPTNTHQQQYFSKQVHVTSHSLGYVRACTLRYTCSLTAILLQKPGKCNL